MDSNSDSKLTIDRLSDIKLPSDKLVNNNVLDNVLTNIAKRKRTEPFDATGYTEFCVAVIGSVDSS